VSSFSHDQTAAVARKLGVSFFEAAAVRGRAGARSRGRKRAAVVAARLKKERLDRAERAWWNQ